MAAISKVLICNMALTSIGEGTIEALDENSAGAKQCASWYDYSRLQALESHDWNFARRRITLASHNDDPPNGVWAFRYQYPSDCIILRKLQNPILNNALNEDGFVLGGGGDQSDAVPYEIEFGEDVTTKSIVTDLDSAIAVYTMDLEDTTLFSPYFIRLLAAALAGNIAYVLTGKNEIEERMFQRFRTLQLAAPVFNANEQMKAPPRDAPWIRGRA